MNANRKDIDRDVYLNTKKKNQLDERVHDGKKPKKRKIKLMTP